jgi:hypothetical protein
MPVNSCLRGSGLPIPEKGDFNASRIKDLLNNKLRNIPQDFCRQTRRKSRRVVELRKAMTTKYGGKKTRKIRNLLFNRS